MQPECQYKLHITLPFQVLVGLQPFVKMRYVLTSVGIRRNEKGIVSWSIVFFVVVEVGGTAFLRHVDWRQ